ncbi:protein ANTAGONIST OF LIKE HETEROCHROMATIN PROTEIN 1-like [Gymnodraco acuticeps]|uniref:Protein ANTAGONIST OF LIKE HETEROCHROMATIN PROTEIN 1-like n=1 Tax=Gymnodraco acuticeps TaxID=8218 RepID=A0A6P8VQ61_GYMAC|nr:protein ANTAGONIST OF LIKE HETEROCHROMATIN PROTEIN 1-like [Gymnodraco acuticeps]
MDAGVVARVSRVTRVCARLHLVYTLSRMRPCSVRRFWVHPILRKRLQRGEYHLLVQELRLDDRLFQRYFRMSKEVLDELLGKVGPLITKVDTHLRMSIGPAERLAICLRYLATGDSYATIAFSYRVGRSTVAVIVKEVAGAIWTALVEECMPVPQVEDWRAIAAGFQERWEFPNCVGAIDGKHVVIQAPANAGSLYFNYKSTHSLVLLAVVDAEYLFRVVDVGGFGRSSDSGSLRNSAFGESLRDGSLQLPPETVIAGSERRGPLPHVFVGDEAFPLLDNLLRPFPGRHLTRERRLFNYRLSRARLVVECAFGILSTQWRMLRRVITTSPEVTELCVKAACVLHNFLRRKTIDMPSRTPIARSTDEVTPTLCDAPRMGSNNATRRSIQQRETFCSYFNEEGAVRWQANVV